MGAKVYAATIFRQRGEKFFPVNDAGEIVGLGYATRRQAIAAHAALKGALFRPCMCCRQPFESAGPFNRLCPHCKGTAARMDPVMI